MFQVPLCPRSSLYSLDAGCIILQCIKECLAVGLWLRSPTAAILPLFSVLLLCAFSNSATWAANVTIKLSYKLSIDTRIDDLKQVNGRHYALFYRIRWLYYLAPMRLRQSAWRYPYCLRQEFRPTPKNIVFSNIYLWLIAIFAETAENECTNHRHPLVKDDNLTELYDHGRTQSWAREM